MSILSIFPIYITKCISLNGVFANYIFLSRESIIKLMLTKTGELLMRKKQ